MSTSLRLAKLATNLDANGDVTSVRGLSYPSSDGANGQVLTTDGSGNLSFTTVSSDVVDDTTPQLGGDLDLNSKSFSGTASFKSGPFEMLKIIDGAGLTMVESNVHPLLINTANTNIYLTAGTSGTGGGGITLSTENQSRIEIANTGPITFNNSYTFPTSDGTSGQVLTTDGSGTLSFGNASGGSSFTASLFHTLDNPNAYSTTADDNFGFSVAVSGNYAIVGAYLEDDAGGSGSGKAYIFNVTTGALVHTLDNPNAYSTSANDNFGYSVAISGNYAIVSAYLEDDAGGSGSGKAYIFNVTTGALLHTLDNPNPYSTSSSDYFGRALAISGNYAIVSAVFEDDAGGITSGKAYIYNVTTGTLLHTLDNPNAYSTSAQDYFGQSVAISGNYAIVGAYQEDDASGTQSGKAYIYNVTTGGLLHTLDNPNAYSTSANDYFGGSVAISNSYAIVSSWGEGDASGSASGKAYIFDVATGALLHTLDNPNAYGTTASDRFSNTVAISGNYAIVGAKDEDDAGGGSSGKAYIFDVTTGTLVDTLDNPNPYATSAIDWFGGSVAISGNYAIVGAYGEDELSGSGSGKAYIYQLANAQPYVLDAAETAGFSSGGISNVVEDTTPQLGGTLDANDYSIIGGTSQYDSLSLWGAENASDGAIWMAGSRNTNNGTVNIAGSNSGSGGTVNINYMGNNGFAYGTTYIGSLYSETFYDNEVYIVNSKWPQSFGSNGQVLTTNGSGTLSWSTPASGGGSFADRYVAAILF